MVCFFLLEVQDGFIVWFYLFFLQWFQLIWFFCFCFRILTNEAAVSKTPPPSTAVVPPPEMLGQNQELAQKDSSFSKDQLSEEMGTLNQALGRTHLTPERLTMALSVLTPQVCVFTLIKDVSPGLCTKSNTICPFKPDTTPSGLKPAFGSSYWWGT